MIKSVVPLAIFALGLAACSSEKAPAPLNEGTAAENVAEENATAGTSAPEPTNYVETPQDNAASTEPQPNPLEQPQQQVRDDADAAGMTARLPDSDESQPANQSQEQK